MICAYDKIYLNQAQRSLGVMFDVAVNEYNIKLTSFYDKFLNSGLSRRFANGDPAVIAGKSGLEMTFEVLEKKPKKIDLPMGKSSEYWTGWAICYYQWYCGKSFKTIDDEVPIEKIWALYHPYHEMDIGHLVEKVDEMRSETHKDSYLKQLRKQSGLSQKELAQITGIPLKTLQQYEQRQKNINKAQVDYVVRLSKALNCNIEILLEY